MERIDPETVSPGMLRAGLPATSWERALDQPGVQAGLVCLAASMAFLIGLGTHELGGIRESRVAACVTDILYSGDWLVPHLQGKPRLEKPPIPYWIIAAAAVVTGRWNLWMLRVPGVLMTGMVFWSVYRIAADARGRRAGLCAALFLASSLFFVHEVRQPSSDLFLICFGSASLAAWWCGYRRPAARLAWWLASGALAGLACECKGPVALAVLGPPLIGFLLCERQLPIPRSRAALLGCAAALAGALIWPVAVLGRTPDAWLVWFSQLDTIAVQPDPNEKLFFYYLLQWPAYLFPWSVFSVVSVVAGVPFGKHRPAPAERFAWLWFVGNLAVFSCCSVRKLHYLGPAVPALAILAGAFAARLSAAPVRARWADYATRLQFLLPILGGLGLAAFWWRRPDPAGRAGMIVALAFALGALACRIGAKRSLAGAWTAMSLLTAGAAGTTFALGGRLGDAPVHHDAFALRLRAQLPRDAEIYFWGDLDPSYWFYLDNRIQPVSEFARRHHPDRPAYFLASAADFELEPQLARQLDIVAMEPSFAKDKFRTVLARPLDRVAGLPRTTP
jgi:4-amino-4-deoxy-L-arabinose transferase-like glycosyltransferase